MYKGTGHELQRLSNGQICALALWILGGTNIPQDLEDVTAKCFELAPGRFSWRRYKYPNLETAWAAMRHDGKKGTPKLISGNKRIGWLLTAEGIEWAKSLHYLTLPSETVGATLGLRREDRAALDSLLSHNLYQAWLSDVKEFEIYEIADAVRLTADAPRDIIHQQIERLRNLAGASGQNELMEFLSWLQIRTGDH